MTFYSNITALVGIAILLNVVCLSMARERKYNSPPKFLKNLFAGVLGKLLCLGNYAHQVINYLISIYGNFASHDISCFRPFRTFPDVRIHINLFSEHHIL